jgi:hypothetical protein
MKTLDLNAYGVHEMDAVEMKKVDGGIIFEIAFGLLIIGVAIFTDGEGLKF